MPDSLLPLHIAVQNGHVNVINRLLCLGANVAATDSNGMNSFHYAAVKDENTIKVTTKLFLCYISLELTLIPGFGQCTELQKLH